MTRSVGRWLGIGTVCAAILFIPIVMGARSAADATAEESFWRSFGHGLVRNDPRHGDKNCDDFTSRRQAQRFFIAHGGPDKDAHQLDSARLGTGDGKACTDFDY